MSSNLAQRYEDNEDYSPGRMDAKSILRDTGANIVATATTKQLGIVIPTDTSGGLIKNVAYYVDYDSSFNRIQFLPIFHKHVHSADTDADGGTLYDIFFNNSSKVVKIDQFIDTQAEAVWQSSNNGTGVTGLNRVRSSPNSFMQLLTGVTANNATTALLCGIGVVFSSKMMFNIKAKLSHNANLLARIGMNVDRAHDTQSTSRTQMGLEGCDGHGTNWVIINANGNTSSLTTTPTTAVLNPVSSTVYKIQHIPATECRLYVAGVSNAVSTTNVANGNSTNEDKLFTVCVKTTDTTEKEIIWRGITMIADPSNGYLS